MLPAATRRAACDEVPTPDAFCADCAKIVANA
jgi:hypothetical protein